MWHGLSVFRKGECDLHQKSQELWLAGEMESCCSCSSLKWQPGGGLAAHQLSTMQCRDKNNCVSILNFSIEQPAAQQPTDIQHFEQEAHTETEAAAQTSWKVQDAVDDLVRYHETVSSHGIAS